MSDSVRPQRRQPTRLPCPWDSPGKNTGVGCHFLLQCMKVKVKSLSRDPMDCSPPGSSVRGIFQARVLERGAIDRSTNSPKEGTQDRCTDRNTQHHTWTHPPRTHTGTCYSRAPQRIQASTSTTRALSLLFPPAWHRPLPGSLFDGPQPAHVTSPHSHPCPLLLSQWIPTLCLQPLIIN